MIAAVIAAGSRVVCGADVRWQCDPRSERQRIYFANHASHLDFLVIWSALPAPLRASARPVAGRDYWTSGWLRQYLAGHVFRAVLVDRSNGRSEAAARSVEAMAAAMGLRESLIVFPEGTRAVDGRVGAFKSGLYHLSCLRPDVELVPVHLANLGRILPKGESLLVPMLSRVVFGPPLQPQDHEDKPAFLERARAALIALGGTP
jgi:1-acyl-sn-glycerol-3-phosphate acyltransferase